MPQTARQARTTPVQVRDGLGYIPSRVQAGAGIIINGPQSLITISADGQESLDAIGNVQGDTLYRGATEWDTLAPGTVGLFLRTNGAAANPSWASPFVAAQPAAVRVVTAAGAVTVALTDYIVVVNKTIGAATVVNLPAGTANQHYVIKDGKGDAGANNITITPAAGTIDGAATLVLVANYASAELVYNGTQWNVI